MIVNENGWGDKKAPVVKEEVKEVKDVRKAKLQKEAPVKEVVVEDAEQE
jgi:hypothetical protein